MTTTDTPNYINHIALVLDASLSMTSVASQLVKVADAEIEHLARRSRELDQETRVTVYAFNDPDKIDCIFYDKDVLRLPSIAGHYRVGGRGTALMDATAKSQLDLEATAQLYGDHAFLTYVLTDGQENYSRRWTASALSLYLRKLPDNWTVACLVPDQRGVFEAKSHGFPADNVAVWDATTERGVTEAVGGTVRRATEAFMVNRSRGIRGSKTLFAGGADAVNRQTVAAARATGDLVPISRAAYTILNVAVDAAIRPFVEDVTGDAYVRGSAYYLLEKVEKVQAQKQVLVRDRKSGRVYGGAQARQLLGLPDREVRVRPDANPLYEIYVQSTSVNRKLLAGTKVLVLT